MNHEPEFTQDWFSQNIGALTELLSDYKDRPTRMLEIGCYEGRSTLWFLKNVLTNRDSCIRCIDHFRGGAEHYSTIQAEFRGARNRFLKNCRPRAVVNSEGRPLYDAGGTVPFHLEPKSKVELFIGDSAEVLTALLHSFYVSGSGGYAGYDIIYIDGNHAQTKVLEDAVLSWPLLRVDGLLIFDDFGFHDPLNDLHPASAIIPFANVYRKYLEVLAAGWLFAVRKTNYQERKV